MKAIKGLALFAAVSILISSCFDPPEFSVEPKIGFESITFGETTDVSEPDSLLLVLNFKDGDGDLGLDESNPAHSMYPFNIYNFFLAKEGNIEAVPSYRLSDSTEIEVLDFLGKDGVLVTADLADDPDYIDDLPDFFGSADCNYRNISSLYVRLSDAGRVPAENRADTVNINGAMYVRLSGLIYRVENENHYNIIVRIFEKTGNGPNDFKEVFFGAECFPDFKGRFPVLTKEDDNTPLEGVLRYAMYSVGIRPVLGLKNFWFEITVKDRLLHTTEPIKTKVYYLDELRR